MACIQCPSGRWAARIRATGVEEEMERLAEETPGAFSGNPLTRVSVRYRIEGVWLSSSQAVVS